MGGGKREKTLKKSGEKKRYTCVRTEKKKNQHRGTKGGRKNRGGGRREVDVLTGGGLTQSAWRKKNIRRRKTFWGRWGGGVLPCAEKFFSKLAF